ncbi:MAG: prolipoprotein diacylglyceryl transferase [Deltaproteobacteria bacterium]|jgi:hypothetical protein|nr:prolipoprotein diacylglyceryl transferase [Deltaproteobacteria bacterium]
MFDRLHDSTQPFLQFMGAHYNPVVFTLFVLLMAFFFVSRRMNARAQAPPAPWRLRRLAQALMPEEKPITRKKGKKKSKPAVQQQPKKKYPLPLPRAVIIFLQDIRLPWLLQKTDWLLHDKLQLLPGARRRLNLFWMLVISWTIMFSNRLLAASEPLRPIYSISRSSGAWASTAQSGLQSAFFLVPLYAFLLALPFFLLRNRELYFDMAAVLILLMMAFHKLIFCWRTGCCFGIPWQGGVYNDTLKTAVFPVQLFEFATGALCAVLCVLYILYAKSYKPGRGCTLCLLSCFVPRFFVDYLRYHGPEYRLAETNGFLGLTMVQIVCVAMAALAAAWWFALPLEKKLMDRFTLFLSGGLRRLAGKSRYLSKWAAWRNSAATR